MIKKFFTIAGHRQSEGQLRELAAHLQAVREEERTRLSRQIHDTFGQELTGLKMDLAWLERHLLKDRSLMDIAPLLDKIHSMSSLMDSMMHLVRRIAAELRPGLLDDLGLVAALEWQAQEFEKRSGIGCHISSSLPETVSLNEEQATVIFRIFQEILTNVARHARATEVTGDLGREGDYIELTVHDNGRGIGAGEERDKKSLGLLGMKERALLLGGDVRIKGEPGKGTTVVVKIPVSSSPLGRDFHRMAS